MKLIYVILASIFCLTVCISSASSAQSNKGNVFEVDAKIFVGDRQIGNPQFAVLDGAEAAIGVSAVGGYGLRLTVDEDANRSGRDSVKVSMRLYFVRGSEWVLVGAPIIQMEASETSQQSSSERTIYGDGGYRLEVTVKRTDRIATVADFHSVENCSLWRALSTDGPLEGVRVIGTKIPSPTHIAQTFDLNPSDCCTSGNMTCCGTGPTCCRDGMTGNNCCNH